MRYRLQRGTVTVTARTSVHDTTTRFSRLAGTIDFDADDPAAARAELAIDMRAFDAGDGFKNWKLKDVIDADAHPTATFTLARFDEIREATAGRWTATALGQVRWRGHQPMVKVKGQASVDRRTIDARASFDLDLRELGMTPPRFLLVAVDDIVSVQVSLFAAGVDR